MTASDQLVRRLVIGVGNDYRGDDGAGLAVIRRIRDNPPAGTATREETGEGAGLIDAWGAFDEVIIVDAASSGEPPGTVFRFDVCQDPIPEGTLRGCSTHAMGIAAVIELARTLNRLPAQLTVYAIEGKDFMIGAPMSPEVLKAVDEVGLLLRREIMATGQELRD
jgi:hydrogenase maturation protease